MIKKTLTALVALSIIIFSISFLHKFIPYLQLAKTVKYDIYTFLRPTRKTTVENNDTNAQKLLGYLKDLSEFPIVGVFFDEKRIKELIAQGKYQECIEESQKALERSANSRSFSIWYSKALSQCFLGRKDDCEMSTNKATLYGKNILHQLMIQNLYLYIEKQMKKGILGSEETIAQTESEEQESAKKVEERGKRKMEEL